MIGDFSGLSQWPKAWRSWGEEKTQQKHNGNKKGRREEIKSQRKRDTENDTLRDYVLT